MPAAASDTLSVACPPRSSWSRSRCRPTATATARSPSRSPTRRPLGRARLASRRRARLGPRRRRSGRCARYLDGWQEYSFELEDIAEVSPGKVVGICRERGVDREGVPVDRRFGGLWVVEDAQDRLLVHLPDPEGGGPGRPRAGEPRAPGSGPAGRGAAAAGARERARRAARSPRPGSTEEQRRAAKARARLQRARSDRPAQAGQDLDRDLRGLGRALADPHALGLERLLLRLRRCPRSRR